MKIVIFGVGDIYKRNRNKVSKEDEIVAFLDNNIQLWGKKCDGIEVFNPAKIEQFEYDKIVIMSASYIEMRDQLIYLGCDRKCILLYTEYLKRQYSGQLSVYFGKNAKCEKKKCLIITTPLEYYGGSIVSVYAALELQDRGYEVVIAASDGNRQFIDEFTETGIIFMIYPNLQYAKWEELFWIVDFEYIIVNTYPMVLCAIEISKHKKVFFWLHENDCVYPVMNFWKDIIMDNILSPNLKIYAVSHVARKNFISNVMECEVGLLPYGIPDVNKNETNGDGRLTFALVGTIHPIKQQLLFLEAVKELNKINSSCKYLIIGSSGNVIEYTQEVEEEAGKISNVFVTGGYTRRKLEKVYSQIDVVVVASLEETMSLVATEAMMYGKVCILCDIAGMARYVVHEKNGFLFKSNDVHDLVKQMLYCIENPKLLKELGENARETYNQYFTMHAFGNRLEDMMHLQVQDNTSKRECQF